MAEPACPVCRRPEYDPDTGEGCRKLVGNLDGKRSFRWTAECERTGRERAEAEVRRLRDALAGALSLPEPDVRALLSRESARRLGTEPAAVAAEVSERIQRLYPRGGDRL